MELNGIESSPATALAVEQYTLSLIALAAASDEEIKEEKNGLALIEIRKND
jgi:hypothetical protein